MWWTTKPCNKHYTLNCTSLRISLNIKTTQEWHPPTRNCFTDRKDPTSLTLQCRNNHNYEKPFEQDNSQSPHYFTLCPVLSSSLSHSPVSFCLFSVNDFIHPGRAAAHQGCCWGTCLDATLLAATLEMDFDYSNTGQTYSYSNGKWVISNQRSA